MTISELICRLQSIKCEHGDLPVYYFVRFAQRKIDLAEAKKIVDAKEESRCGEAFVALTSKS